MKLNSQSPNNVIELSDWTDFDHNFYDERIFQEVLRIERKRSERSSRPFLLMLVDVTKIVHSKNGKTTFRNITAQLHIHTRETDIKGWYADKSVIGVLFTEMGEHDQEFIMERIIQRVRNSLFFVIDSHYFQDMKLSLQWFPDSCNGTTDSYEVNPLFYPDLLERAFHKAFAQIIKRFIDIVGSLVGLAVFSPLFIVIPILIKLTSKGPVFFNQERVGLFGRKINFLKFRSMRLENVDTIHRNYIKNFIANETADDVFKIQEDPRITLLGKFLRKTSLDELPQFINVLKGEMSLVGPRPPIPYECDEYKLWHLRRVIEVKPGITGLWQVEGRSSTSFDEMVRLDLKYIREWSLWLDIKIILKTPWVVITGKGAY